MPLLLPEDSAWFPPEEVFTSEGLVGVGGGLGLQRLIAGYARGIFPWYDESTPVLWWNPPERCVLIPDQLHVPRSLVRSIRSRRYRISLDQDFAGVIAACAANARPGQNGTWITPDMQAAYCKLHEAGFAHSVEAWDDEGLAGGLYGVSLGSVFFGESMFFHRPDASKTALVWLVSLLRYKGFSLVDCQQVTSNLLRFGARSVSRPEFMSMLKAALRDPGWIGQWTMSDDFFPL